MIALAYYSLKRIARHRSVLIALFTVPLVLAIAGLVPLKWDYGPVVLWASPIICALFVVTVLHVLAWADRTSGLDASLRSTPISDSDVLFARLATGIALFVGQMIVFVGLTLLIR